MKKFVSLLAVSLLMASMTVSAANSPSAGAVSPSAGAVLTSAKKAVYETPAYVKEGFENASDAQQAEARGMSAGEYYNNAIVSVPGVENTLPVGQGGKVIVNGVVTNMTATLSKVNVQTAEQAKEQASALGGNLLNVVSVSVPGNFLTATVNFYVKDLTAGTKVVAKQYVDGAWYDVEVAEVRADHVVLNLEKNGVVAFVALP